MFSSFYPKIGGVEKHVEKVCEELIKKSHEVTIITTNVGCNLPAFEKINDINIFRIPIQKRNKIFFGIFNTYSIQIWKWIFRHRKLLRNANVVHCHDYTFLNWYLPFRFMFPMKPVFVTFHGFEGVEPISKKTIYLRKVIEKLSFGNICIGDFILKWFGTKTDFISYGGVDEKKISINNEVDDYNSAVFIGRLEKDTGILVYIEAIKLMKEQTGINIRFDICGDGSLIKEIERIKLEKNLDLRPHGFIQDPTIYLNRNRFAFVSGYLAILEAMAQKKLVFSVCENELKKDYLTLIPDSKNMMVIAPSAKQLYSEIVYYIENPEKIDEKIKKAYDFAKKQTWKDVAELYLKLWGFET